MTRRFTVPQQNHQKFMLCALSGLKTQSEEQRTGQMATSQSGPHVPGVETYFMCACAHINTHSYRNVSRRSGCQGFPLCWPAVTAAAGCALVFRRTTRRGTSTETRTVTSHDYRRLQTDVPVPRSASSWSGQRSRCVSSAVGPGESFVGGERTPPPSVICMTGQG